MTDTRRCLLALSIGCPCGVGPEVSVVAAARSRARVALVGDHRVILRAATSRGVSTARFVRIADASELAGLSSGVIGVLQPTATLPAKDSRPGEPTAVAGAAQLAWIDAACDLASRGEVDAMVTGPVSKEMVVRSRAPGSAGFKGHTEHLEARLHAREVVMAFWSRHLSTSLVTTHLPLARVARAITPAAVGRAAYWLAWLLARLGPRGDGGPTIAVCGLNPHAGEAGLLGLEESRSITPGIATARARLARDGVRAQLVGPVGAESAFRLAVGSLGGHPQTPGRRFDGVVAMYHDQATIPMKIAGFGEAVNVSLGLPIIRTSVDHGTGYDIAGKNIADARGMILAIALAARLAGVSGAGAHTRAARGARRTPPRRSA